ncbi:hypothetical protein [Mangrovimonas sp. DI 80]|uniref:hypothetical protein n=1 Tax=Mangrovimonas sp. DI 80 TaxID=1779330 RepID=UPI000977B39C|nr:hypothetical protein [Mangrovimonas sp. DI 80]OMP32278.1 hypothetical protein BKM32_04295 [Mangrovimonas sp. DI 80]
MEDKIRKFWQLFKQQSLVNLLYANGTFESFCDLLSDEEIDSLIQLNVIFIRSVSPSSTIRLSDVSANNQGNLILINIDANRFNAMLPEENIAILLHEIGHVFNPNINGIDGEYLADNYAKQKGYGRWIISGLKKGLNNKWIGFDEKEIELRIKNLQG